MTVNARCLALLSRGNVVTKFLFCVFKKKSEVIICKIELESVFKPFLPIFVPYTKSKKVPKKNGTPVCVRKYQG